MGKELDGNTTLRQRGHNNMFKHQNKNYSWAKSLTGKRPCAQEGAAAYETFVWADNL